MITFLYDLFYMLPLAVATILGFFGLNILSSVMVSRTADETVSVSPFAACMVGCAFIIIVLTLRHAGKKERYLIGGGIAVAVASLWWILGEERRGLLYGRCSWMLWIIGIAVVAMIIGRLSEDILWIKITMSIAFLSEAIYLMVGKKQCPKGTLAFAALVIMIYLVEMIQRYWKKSGYTELKSHVALIAPMLLVLCILVTVIPTPDEAFDWKIAKNIWKATVTEYKRFVGMISANKDEYGYAGFSENGTVYEGVAENGREVMYISCDKNSFDRLYMGGITYETFNGQGWETDLDNADSSRTLDFIETRAAIAKHKKGYEREYIRVDNITVESRLFNTKHVFIPIKSNTLLPKYKESASKISADTRLRYGDTYNINYMLLNNANPELVLTIDTAQEIREDEWNAALKKSDAEDNKNYSYDRYLKYKDGIYKKYGGNQSLSLEEALEASEMSDGVKDIVRTVIESAVVVQPDIDETSDSYDGEELKSSGDYEKLKALSEYLQTKNYNRNPGALPADVKDAKSYLDYLLLESENGYCVHFATAFTLLARELGYPARYVQGYYVKRGKGTDVLVSENRAHAWTEVYFDNFGWVTFESTPGYAMSKGWAVQGKVENTKEIRMEAYQAEESLEETSVEEIPQEKEKKYVNILIFIIPVVSAVFFVMLYLFISRLVADNKYRKMNNAEKVRIMIDKNMRILRIMGYPLDELETIDEFYAKVSREETIAATLVFLKLYEKILYSDYVADANDVENIEKNYAELKSVLRSKGGRYRLYLV